MKNHNSKKIKEFYGVNYRSSTVFGYQKHKNYNSIFKKNIVWDFSHYRNNSEKNSQYTNLFSIVPDTQTKSNIERCWTNSHNATPPAWGQTGTEKGR